MEIIAIFIAICIVVSIVQAVVNLNSPVISREARIVRKYEDEGMRDEHGRRTHWGYYVVFEFSNGQRQRFRVNSWQYFQLSRGTTGVLQSQGSWYKGFDKV